MPRSRFSPRRAFIKTGGNSLAERNFYDLRGLNTYQPDETMPDTDTPDAENFRVYDKKDGSRTTISKRKGHRRLSVPIGEATTVTETSTAGADEITIDPTHWVANSFNTAAAGRVSRISLNIKNAGTGRGPVIVEIRKDNAGIPGEVLATSSLDQSNFTDSFAYNSCYSIEAPDLLNATQYWIVVYTQADGEGLYTLSTTTNSSHILTSSVSGNVWSGSEAASLNFNLYYATAGTVIGQHRFYRYDNVPEHLFWHLGSMYKINEVTGVTTLLTSGMDATADHVFADTINKKTYFCNGIDIAKVYTGTGVANVTASLGSVNPQHQCHHKNRLFYLLPGGKLVFSETADYENFLATSFVYVPSPSTSDPPIAMFSYQDNLIIFTRNTKWVLYGSDIASFVLRESTAKKGATGATAIAQNNSHLYFLSDDGIYRFNGGTDDKVSTKVDSIVSNFADPRKVDFTAQDDKLWIHYRSSGQGFNNNCLIFDTSYKTWMLDTDIYIEGCVRWNGGNDLNELVGGNSRIGMLVFKENGGSDCGKPITLDYRTKYMTNGSPVRKQQYKRLYPALRGQDGNHKIDVQVDVDEYNSPSSNWVSLAKGGDIWGSGELWGGGAVWGGDPLPLPRLTLPGSNRKHQIRFVQTGVNNPVDIIGYTYFFRMKRAT